MNKYELMLIVNAHLPQPEKEVVFNEAADVITKGEGKIINRNIWLEKQKISFPIKKCSEGTYYQVNFECGGSALLKIKELLRLNEKILRFLILRIV